MLGLTGQFLVGALLWLLTTVSPIIKVIRVSSNTKAASGDPVVVKGRDFISALGFVGAFRVVLVTELSHFPLIFAAAVVIIMMRRPWRALLIQGHRTGTSSHLGSRHNRRLQFGNAGVQGKGRSWEYLSGCVVSADLVESSGARGWSSSIFVLSIAGRASRVGGYVVAVQVRASLNVECPLISVVVNIGAIVPAVEALPSS
jgi:hypothetical protein